MFCCVQIDIVSSPLPYTDHVLFFQTLCICEIHTKSEKRVNTCLYFIIPYCQSITLNIISFTNTQVDDVLYRKKVTMI